jgi:hypothetical protein
MSNNAPAPGHAAAPLPPPHPLALRLGYLGLLPFVVGALLIWLLTGYEPEAHAFAALGLSCYAAVIVSFLGGIHWGLAMRSEVLGAKPYVWGLVASTLAWVAAVMPAYAGLVVHGVVLVLCYLVDRRFYPPLGAAAWLTLRFRLSAVAALCCFLGAAGS